jgi:surface antigen
MRTTSSLVPLAATAVTAFSLCAWVVLSANVLLAAEKAPGNGAGAGTCSCPEKSGKPSTRPKFADLKSGLDESDEIAALESVQFALAEVGDGATYVWHRRHGRLSGVVQPTTSFKDAYGNVCRHVMVMLTSGPVSKKTEGIACRLANGIWQLDG